MASVIRAYTPARALIAEIPSHTALRVQQEHNMPGSMTFTALNNSPGIAALNSNDAYLAVMDDGVLRPDFYLLEEDGDDPADDGGEARPVMVTGRGLLARLEEAVVYPRDATPAMTAEELSGLAPHHEFLAVTPGQIMGSLLTKAQARGALAGITWDFTAALDSAGRPWPTYQDVIYDAGLDLLKVVTALCDNARCDVRMDYLTLRLFVPDTVCGVDRPNVLLRKGKEVLAGPRKRSRRGVKTVLLAVGDDNLVYEGKDPTGVATYGRREGYEARGGMKHLSSLTVATTASLAAQAKVAEGFTVAVDLSVPGAPVPGDAYNVGDRIRYDQRRLDPANLEPLRVRTIAWSWDDSGNKTVSVELNDLFVEAQVRLQRKIDGIVNGSTSAAPVPTGPPPEGFVEDTLAPKPPSTVAVQSEYITLTDGRSDASAFVTWTAVTQNVDNTAYDDHGTYAIEYRLSGPDILTPRYVRIGNTPETQTVIAPLPPGYLIEVRVTTLDRVGNWSQTWTNAIPHTLARDTTPPPTPSPPIMSDIIGGARATWDGKGSAGEDMPRDFSHVEVHRSTSTQFVPTDATRVDRLEASGISPIVGLPYDSTQYIRFVAVDRSGNKSGPSVQASTLVKRVTGLDLAEDINIPVALADGQVTAAKIAAGAVETSKIANLAITTGLLANSAVGAEKIATGAITAVKIDAGAVTAVKIAAGAVSTEKLTVGALSDNAVSNSEFHDQGGDGFAAGWTAGTGLAYSPASATEAPGVVMTYTSSDVRLAQNQYVTVLPGERWYVSARVRMTGSGTASVQLRVTYHVATSGTQVGTEVTLGTTSTLNGTTPQVLEGMAAVPATNTIGTMRITVLHVLGGQIKVSAVTAQRMTGAASILDAAIVSAKIADAAIVSAKIADLAVLNAKIANLAVDDAKIGNVNVGKLVAGSLTADITVSARIKTADVGARVELGPLGVKQYNAQGVLTVDINTNGAAFFRGTVEGSMFRTAAFGRRLEISSALTDPRQIRFYNPLGANYAGVRAYDAGVNTGIAVESAPSENGSIGFMNVSDFASDLGYGFPALTASTSYVRVDAGGILLGAGQALPVSAQATGGFTVYSGTRTYAQFWPGDNSLRFIGRFINNAVGGAFEFGESASNPNNAAPLYANAYIATIAGAQNGFLYFSDERAKEDIEDAVIDGLGKVRRTKVRRYKWKRRPGDRPEVVGGTATGFVAQEVPSEAQVSMPGNVDLGITNPVGYSVDGMLVVLWKAVQDLDAKVTAVSERRDTA